MGFKVHKASVLTEEELGHLVVRGTGLNVAAKLQEHGAVAEEPCAAIIMSVEQGKVQGSMWMITGNMGSVKFSTGKVGGGRNVNVWLNLTDLTQFSFPRIVDPRESGNLSDWYEAIGLVTRLQDGIADLRDPSDIKQHELFEKKKGFSLRLTVVPLAMGLVTVWLGAAPGTPDMIKKTTIEQGLTEASALIPTTGVKLTKGMGMEAKGKLRPVESAFPGTGSSWGHVPIIEGN